MIVISSREFRDNQKTYFDLIDKNEQVIVQRGKNKAYLLTPVSESDRYFNQPHIAEKLNRSIQEYNEGKTIQKNENETLDSFLSRLGNV